MGDGPHQEDKGLEESEKAASLPRQACWDGAGSPSIPLCCASPADGKYWCCDFINKGFCEPEKHGIRMNYFLSCGLARFANLGVFGPSPGNKVSPEEKEKDEGAADAAQQRRDRTAAPARFPGGSCLERGPAEGQKSRHWPPSPHLCSGELLG